MLDTGSSQTIAVHIYISPVPTHFRVNHMAANITHTDISVPLSPVLNSTSNDIIRLSVRLLRASTSQLSKQYFMSDSTLCGI